MFIGCIGYLTITAIEFEVCEYVCIYEEIRTEIYYAKWIAVWNCLLVYLSKVDGETKWAIFIPGKYGRAGPLALSWFNKTGAELLLNVIRDHTAIVEYATVWELDYKTRDRHRVDTGDDCAYLSESSIPGLVMLGENLEDLILYRRVGYLR